MFYYSTGKGGHFFKNIYTDAYSVDNIRKVPCTIEELSEGGLSQQDIDKYFLLIKQLYSELYFKNCWLLPTKGVECNAKEVWQQINDFCLQHSLTPEFVNKDGECPKAQLPSEVEFFFFVYRDEHCPGEIYITTLDDFRLIVEYCLDDLPCDWYLNLRYDIDILFITDDNGGSDRLAQFNPDTEEFEILSEGEALLLQQRIKQDIDECEKRKDIHQRNVPVRPLDSAELRVKFEWHDKCREWFKEGIALQYEYDAIDSCDFYVSNIVDSYEHEEIIDNYPDDTLYVYKGQIKCLRDKHPIEQATAILLDKNGNDIELNVSHCLTCNKFFIQYDIYKRYRDKYGCILGNIHMAKNGEFCSDNYDLADESPLRLCGYSVSQKERLSKWERQDIIVSCIESGGMTKESVIRLLQWFIEVNGNKKGNEIAYKKWCTDLDFVLAYDTDKQDKFRIRNIERYNRNRFVCKRNL